MASRSAGARDPVVGTALALLHRRPCQAWTLAELAEEVGAARRVVAERFARLLVRTAGREAVIIGTGAVRAAIGVG
jgi:transcriptional regulator GlxA family with amidase domain